MANEVTEPIRLSFTLTRLQRVLNPLERLLAVFFSVFLLLLIPLTVLGECLAKGSSPQVRDSVVAILVLEFVVAAFILLFFGRSLLMFLHALLGKTYINTLVVDGDRVLVGANEAKSAFCRRSLVVGRGLCRTIVVRYPFRYSITVPRSAISLEGLKAAIERDDCFWRDFWRGRILYDKRRGAASEGDVHGTANVDSNASLAADAGETSTDRLRISFRLSPLQRLLNPRKKFVFIVCGVVVIVAILATSLSLACTLLFGLFGKSSGFARNAIAIWKPLLALALIGGVLLLVNYVVVAFFVLVCRGMAFGVKYVNILAVRGDLVQFGVDKLETTVSREVVAIQNGVWGTVLLYYPGGAITLPLGAVSAERLRRAIEEPNKESQIP